MKTKKKFKLALVGTDSLKSKEIKNVLSQKKFPLQRIEFYDQSIKEEYSKLTYFRKEPKVIHGLKEDSLKDVDLVFLAADKKTNQQVRLMAEKLHFQAIDLSETFNAQEDVPLFVAGVNDDLLIQKKYHLIANPHPVTVVLSHLFHLVIPALGIQKAIAFVLQPVSAFDDPGIQELASQSVALLNSSSLSKKVFKEQIAFNIISHIDKPDENGFCSHEKQIVLEIKRVLNNKDFPFSLSIIQAPIFHTYSLMTYLELQKEAEIQDLENLFKENSTFKVAPLRDSCSVTSLSVSGKDEIFIGQIKKEESFPRCFWIWLVADNLTRGSALNAFEIAKRILLVEINEVDKKKEKCSSF